MDEARWLGVANILGFIMALAAIGMVVRFAVLLAMAYQGHPRLVG